MNFLCPACRTPLPSAAHEGVVPCTRCGVQVDLTRVDTAPGTARLWPDVDLTGESLGGYRLVKRLAAGGMGVVYEAEGPQGRCAVKVLSALLAAEPELRTRFRREAAALRAIEHPGVTRIFAEGEERGFCFYAMERVDGLDLRARLLQGPVPAKEVEALARSLLATLAVVHEKGFVHRDLKPGNVLLSPQGPKLCDFGIARFDGSSTLTESAAVLGSLRYMAPEQRLGKPTALSDLYALGILIHEALAGGVPGEKDLPPGVPGRLRRLIETLTAERQVNRPVNARRALAALERKGARPIALAGLTLALVALVSLGGMRLLRSEQAVDRSSKLPGPAALGTAQVKQSSAVEPVPPRDPKVQAMQGTTSEGLARQAAQIDLGKSAARANRKSSSLEDASTEATSKGPKASPPKQLGQGNEAGEALEPNRSAEGRSSSGPLVRGLEPANARPGAVKKKAVKKPSKAEAPPNKPRPAVQTANAVPLQVTNQAQEMELQQFAPSKVKPWRKTSVMQVEFEPTPIAPAPSPARSAEGVTGL